ncbi:MAG: hypothetical protein ABI658_14485 [Acidimicrobiales bacterium]
MMGIETTNSNTKRRTSRFGIGLLCLGMTALSLGAFSSGASAWEGSCYDYAPSPGAWSEFRVELANADIAMITGAGQPSNDGVLTVVLSGATAANGEQEFTVDNVGSIDFTASPGVAAVYVRAGVTADKVYLYDHDTTAGTALSSQDGTTPIEWLTFCYAPETQTTTTSTTTTLPTTTSTTTSTTTTTLATTTSSTAPQQVIEVSTTVPTAVLGEQIERVPQPALAFTGAHTSRLLFLGVVLMLAGLAITLVDRFAAPWRRAN